MLPSFKRVLETAVELQAGQTFAIAGLLQSRTEANRRATPFFGEIPYIGVMFRRMQERRNDIELLITVTPELVDAMNPEDVPPSGPGLNSASPNDCELYLKGYLEVPNLLGSDMHCQGDSHCGPMGMPGGMIQPGGMTGVPSEAIVPGAAPTEVGEGVTVEAPAP